jgi:hypothetical protein
MSYRKSTGFSLIEIVIAIGVVAGGVAVILAILPSLIRQNEESTDLQTALRLPDAVENRLYAEMNGAFPGDMLEGIVLVAGKEGSNVRPERLLNSPALPAYFYIEVSVFTTGELTYQLGRLVLPLQVRVAWPYAAVEAAGGPDNSGNFQTTNFIVTLSP